MDHGTWIVGYGLWDMNCRIWLLDDIYRLDRMLSHDKFLYPEPTDLVL